MTAWVIITGMLCLLVKLIADFIALEYGIRYPVLSDWCFLYVGAVVCAYALLVDFVNFVRRSGRVM